MRIEGEITKNIYSLYFVQCQKLGGADKQEEIETHRTEDGFHLLNQSDEDHEGGQYEGGGGLFAKRVNQKQDDIMSKLRMSMVQKKRPKLNYTEFGDVSSSSSSDSDTDMPVSSLADLKK